MHYKAYKFTVKELAEATKLTENTVNRHIKRGVVNPNDLSDVSRYVVYWRLIGKVDF